MWNMLRIVWKDVASIRTGYATQRLFSSVIELSRRMPKVLPKESNEQCNKYLMLSEEGTGSHLYMTWELTVTISFIIALVYHLWQKQRSPSLCRCFFFGFESTTSKAFALTPSLCLSTSTKLCLIDSSSQTHYLRLLLEAQPAATYPFIPCMLLPSLVHQVLSLP